MQALIGGRDKVPMINLRSWLRHGEVTLTELNSKAATMSHLAPHNRLSQINVIRQLEHLKTYPIVQERLKAGELTLHGWWFELSRADVYAYKDTTEEFVLLDEVEAGRILERIEHKP